VEAVSEGLPRPSGRHPGGIVWLLDLVEEHRAAVRYDLLRHGYRLEWLGTRRLPWGDAFAILSEQIPAQSAVQRALNPEDFDRTREVQALEVLSVLVQHVNLRIGNGLPVFDIEPPSGPPDLPGTFPELFAEPAKPDETDDEILAGIADFEAFLRDTTTD
jgi:hypothetical protein